MPARISLCRNIGMPEIEAAKNNTVGFNETLSGLWLQGHCKPFETAGEHCDKPWCFSFFTLLCQLKMLRIKPKSFYMIATRQCWPGLHTFCF